jgi:hypothetical protein
MLDFNEFRVGQPYPFENVLPGVERGDIDLYTPDLFHIVYYAVGAGPLVIDAFRHEPIYYGMSEPLPGVPFFVFDIGGDNQWAVDLGLNEQHLQDAAGEAGLRTWYNHRAQLLKRPSQHFTLPMTLVCAETNTILALRHFQAPVQLALEARELLKRQQQYAPGVLADQLQQAVQQMYTAEALINCAGTLHCQPASPRRGNGGELFEA